MIGLCLNQEEGLWEGREVGEARRGDVDEGMLERGTPPRFPTSSHRGNGCSGGISGHVATAT